MELSSSRQDLLAGPGSGGTDNVPASTGVDAGSNDSNRKLHSLFGASSGHSFFSKEKVIPIFARPMLVTQPGSGKKFHRFDFFEDPLPEKWFAVAPYGLDIQLPLCSSTNARLISDVLKASLNNAFKDTGIHEFKETSITE